MSQSTVPYIGSKISLVSNSEIRYEGVLYTINTQESTIALQGVRCFGTEGRKMPEIPPSSEVYDFIIFRGQDIIDLTVLEACQAVNDPAIVSINQRPPGGKGNASNDASTAGNKSSSKSTYHTNNQSSGSGGWSQQWYGGSNQHAVGAGSDRNYRGERGDRGGWGYQGDRSGYGGYGGYGSYGYSKSGGSTAQKGTDTRKGGKDGTKGKSKGSKGAGKGSSIDMGKGGARGAKGFGGGSGDRPDRFDRSGGRRVGGGPHSAGGVSGAVGGAPVGELTPETNADNKKEFVEEFDVTASNDKFDKIQTIDGANEVADRLKPLSGYDKAKSFFDSISCEATERAAEAERQRVDRDQARQFDRETFGDTRRPPRPAGGRSGKGRRRGGAPRGYRS